MVFVRVLGKLIDHKLNISTTGDEVKPEKNSMLHLARLGMALRQRRMGA
jgi:hypothetical protein